MKRRDRRKRFFANKMHGEIFTIVFWAASFPAFIVTIALYYLIFHITADQLGLPEAIAYNIIPAAQRVTIILLIATPITIMIIMFLAHRITHKIVGPFDRIVRELDEHLNGTRQGPITIRKSDKFLPLVDRINLLLEKK